ncbi:hypothetical protein BDEG_28591 [Batrachochytrium dendrobatidis JEL423]|uniref:Uncharacterized protein n=1 Tax=Batrachochytrium dendrobatidis (strain JEL423) TaxID=403673 RepID=A0A177X116_BATDL|nr:hypothetical protein BDEG_28591 [Batrachochytrium dendrobatidis JEL423]
MFDFKSLLGSTLIGLPNLSIYRGLIKTEFTTKVCRYLDLKDVLVMCNVIEVVLNKPKKIHFGMVSTNNWIGFTFYYCLNSLEMLETCWKPVGNLLETCWKPVGNLLETCYKENPNNNIMKMIGSMVNIDVKLVKVKLRFTKRIQGFRSRVEPTKAYKQLIQLQIEHWNQASKLKRQFNRHINKHHFHPKYKTIQCKTHAHQCGRVDAKYTEKSPIKTLDIGLIFNLGICCKM